MNENTELLTHVYDIQITAGDLDIKLEEHITEYWDPYRALLEEHGITLTLNPSLFLKSIGRKTPPIEKEFSAGVYAIADGAPLQKIFWSVQKKNMRYLGTKTEAWAALAKTLVSEPFLGFDMNMRIDAYYVSVEEDTGAMRYHQIAARGRGEAREVYMREFDPHAEDPVISSNKDKLIILFPEY